MNEKCQVDPLQKTATAEELEVTTSVFLVIYGMGCPNCAARVRNSLLSVTGVVDAYADHIAGLGYVVLNPNLTTTQALIDAVARAGGDGRHEYWAVRLC